MQNPRAISENPVSGAEDHVFPPAKLLAAAANRVRATRDRIALLHDLRATASNHASPARDLLPPAFKEIAKPGEHGGTKQQFMRDRKSTLATFTDLAKFN